MRINEIASFIEKTNIVVDVGSDHAKLSKILIDKNISNIVYNIEKNIEPYKTTVSNTNLEKYKNRIINIFSNGFNEFDKNIKIDYCVISGLGTFSIIDIINTCKNKVDYFLICSNNNSFLIRKWFKKNNWKILKEKTIIENEFFYEILLFSIEKGKKIYTNYQCYFGIKSIKKNDFLYIDKVEKEYTLLLKNIEEIKKNNNKKYNEFKKIKRFLKKWKN